MEYIDYKYTWCEYLTKCPNGRNTEVGSYDCEQCPFFGRTVKCNPISVENGNYANYLKTETGTIICNFKK